MTDLSNKGLAMSAPRGMLSVPVVALAVAVAAAACQPAPQSGPAPVRPVRTLTVEAAQRPPLASFAGRIEAQDQPSLAFRIAGRVAERPVAVGARLQTGDVVARLDSENELNALRSAEAAFAAAQSAFRQADGHYQRQSRLHARGVATVAELDDARQARKTTLSRVEATEAQLRNAEHLVSFTTLKADAPGIVTAVGAEPGEVVAPGRMVARLAREGGIDAVFDVPPELVRSYVPSMVITVALSADPAQRVTGRVREVSPQADPQTRTFRVRIGLDSPPAAFRLGATVTGTLAEGGTTVLTIPASALIKRETRPTVWVVDPGSMTLAARPVTVERSDAARVMVSGGLAPGDVVVTAGADLLKAGQKIRLMGAEL
jgi:RND family efflux transporter MFP subunit